MTVRVGRIVRSIFPWPLPTLIVIGATLGLSGLMGLRPSVRMLALIAAAIGFVLLAMRPHLGLPVLVVLCIVGPLTIGTGSEVAVNPATLFIPLLFGVWLLSMVTRKHLDFASSRVNRPLLLFLAAALMSLLIGQALWDPFVPQSNSFVIVQLAQWSIFAFAAAAFWLAGNLIRDEAQLRRFIFTLIGVAALSAIARTLPQTRDIALRVFTFAVQRPPFWIALAALAGGQLLFNRALRRPVQVALGVILAVTVFYSFVFARATLSYWAGIAVVLAVLFWLRLRRGRIAALALIVILAVSGQALPQLYSYAGGESEWVESGGSRMVLIRRVVEVTMRNPITGLGPAAYRPYARMKPLPYEGAFWIAPNVSSHNNYVDLFAHTGIVGLLIFAWFMGEVIALGIRLRRRNLGGLALGYVNGVIAAAASSLLIMMLADWLLPFVYNISFEGFQASILIWLMMGGLLAVERMTAPLAPATVEASPA